MPQIEIHGFEEINRKLRLLPAALKTEIIKSVGAYAVKQLSIYPPRVTHGENNPYIWNSERQRKAFFATNGFGRGIPTKRTDELKKGWLFQETPTGGWIKNSTPYASFVMGDTDHMQRGHIADGWQRVSKVMGGLNFWGWAKDVTDKAVKRVLKSLRLID